MRIQVKTLVLTCLLQTAAVLPASDPASLETAQYSYPWGSVVVSFDLKTVTKSELDQWMRFSPELSPYNDLLVPVDIRRCVTGQDGYTDCGRGATLRISNVDINIHKIQTIKQELDNQRVPKGLLPVVAYLSEVQRFWLWSAQQQREFLATHDISALKNRYNIINPDQSCSGILEKIVSSSLDDQTTNLVVVDWANCVWSQEAKRIGPYPKAAWHAFLKDRKITELGKDQLPDD